MQEREILLYTTSTNKCPFIEWTQSLSTEYRVRVYKRINRLKFGNFGDCKKLQNSQLSELRLKFGKGYRIYFKEVNNVIILILAGSDKSNQTHIIKQADEYYTDYITRELNNDNKI